MRFLIFLFSITAWAQTAATVTPDCLLFDDRGMYVAPGVRAKIGHPPERRVDFDPDTNPTLVSTAKGGVWKLSNGKLLDGKGAVVTIAPDGDGATQGKAIAAAKDSLKTIMENGTAKEKLFAGSILAILNKLGI
jgi:hypothetical protein